MSHFKITAALKAAGMSEADIKACITTITTYGSADFSISFRPGWRISIRGTSKQPYPVIAILRADGCSRASFFYNGSTGMIAPYHSDPLAWSVDLPTLLKEFSLQTEITSPAYHLLELMLANLEEPD